MASADHINDPDALRRIANSPSLRDIAAQYHGGRKDGKFAKPIPPPVRGLTYDELRTVIDKPISRKSSINHKRTREIRRDSSAESYKRGDSSARSDESDASEDLKEKRKARQGRPPAHLPPEAKFSLSDLHQIISDVLDTRLNVSLPEFVTNIIYSRIGTSGPQTQVNQSFDLRVMSETVAQIVDDRLRAADTRRASLSPEMVSHMIDIKVEEKLRSTLPLEGYREGGCSY